MPFIQLALLIAGSAPLPFADTLLLSMTTARSFDSFESCFVSIQEAQSRPSWLVLNESGGRISNEGTDGVANPYRIRFTRSGQSNLVEAYVGKRGGTDERPLLAALKRCV